MDPGKIFVVQIGRIGDMILTTPLLKSLKKLYPGSEVTVVASGTNLLIAESCPYTDRTIVYSRNAVTDLLNAAANYKKADLWIDAKPEHSTTSRILLTLYKPKTSVGYLSNSTSFNRAINEMNIKEHYVDIYLGAAIELGFSPNEADRIPEISINKNLETEFESSLEMNNNSLKVLCNFSAGKQGRELPADSWREVFNAISDSKTEISVIGAPEDSERISGICSGTRARHIRTENILHAAILVKNSDIVISPDTSIVHMCSAFNVPVVSLYPDVEWNLRRFYPLSDKKEVIVSDSPHDIKSIKPQEIMEAFVRLVN